MASAANLEYWKSVADVGIEILQSRRAGPGGGTAVDFAVTWLSENAAGNVSYRYGSQGPVRSAIGFREALMNGSFVDSSITNSEARSNDVWGMQYGSYAVAKPVPAGGESCMYNCAAIRPATPPSSPSAPDSSRPPSPPSNGTTTTASIHTASPGPPSAPQPPHPPSHGYFSGWRRGLLISVIVFAVIAFLYFIGTFVVWPMWNRRHSSVSPTEI